MESIFIALLTVYLHFPENGSLKGKRKEITSLKAQIARRFGAAVAEVDHHDLWQRSTLAVVLVGSSASALDRAADSVERYLASRVIDLRTDRDLVSLSDLR